MECLWVASPDTAAAIRAHHRGRLKPADLTKLALTTSRYLARLRSRATPFGLFAGVALGTVGEAAAIRLGDRHAKTGRPDGDCLAEVARRIESELAADGEVLLMAHPLCQVRGDRLERITATSTVTVRANALVQAVIRQLDRSRTMPELLAELDQRFPALGRDKILGVVRVLLAQGFLVSDVLADLTEADPLPRLCSLATTGTTGLSTAAEALGEYLKRPPGTAESELIGARERLTAVAGDGSPQVDLLVDAEVTVPAHVLTEAAAAATVLWRVSAPRSAMAELADFRDALMERYGYNVVVPIVEALDPVHGLDAPAGYRNPVSTRTVEANPPSRDVAVLGRLIQEATMEGRREIVLTEEVIAALDEDPQSPVWRSTSLNFHLLADSTDAIDRGDYTVLCAAGGLSRRAGQVHGRFVHALGAVDTLTDVFAADGEAGGVEQVQLSYRPVSDRMSNVMRVPRLTARTVSLDSPTPAELRVGDLGVCADESGLAIVSLHDGAELEACAGHMANSGDFAPNIARFISEVELLNTRVAAPWSWRDLEALPFLPRVRHGRVVLRPAQWRPPGPSGSVAQDVDNIRRWQLRWRIPDAVLVHSDTNQLAVDLSSPWDRRLLVQEVDRRGDKAVVMEDLSAAGGFAWTDGHAHEFSAMLFASPEHRRRPRPAATVSPARERPVPPGGEWLYAKVFLDQGGYEPLLLQAVPRLLADLPEGIEWYFIRYSYPDTHLRLRFHGAPEVLNTVVLPRLHEWARAHGQGRLIRSMELAEHVTEPHRYGVAALPAAQRVFQCDSEMVLAQLEARAASRLAVSADVMAACGYLQILTDLDWPGWREWLLGIVPASARHGVPREDRKAIWRVVDHRRLRPTIGEQLPEIAPQWNRRSGAVAAYAEALAGDAQAPRWHAVAGDLLHMHFNRLVGADRSAENRSLSLLRETVHAWSSRGGRHGG